MAETGRDPNFEGLSNTALDDLLRLFYAEVRTMKGELYSKSSMLCIKSSIFRHLTNPPFNRHINPTSEEFSKSNKMFVGIIKKLRREGKDQATHYPPISQEDLDILRKGDCYNLNNPKSLQMKVWFDIHFNFIRRGRENDRALSKNSFELRTDGAGRRFLQLGYIEKQKKKSSFLKFA